MMSAEVIVTLVGAILSFLGALISAAGAVYARRVRREMQISLIEPRLQAYRELWKHLQIAAPSRRMEDPRKRVDDETNRVKEKLTTQDLEKLTENLRCWYYSEGEGGNGIFLSGKAHDAYFEALKSVLDASMGNENEETTREVVGKLSKLRTETKHEIAVYERGGVLRAHESTAALAQRAAKSLEAEDDRAVDRGRGGPLEGSDSLGVASTRKPSCPRRP